MRDAATMRFDSDFYFHMPADDGADDLMFAYILMPICSRF